MTSNNNKGIFSAGFGLLWRRQGVLWWVFVVNLICGALGTLSATIALGRAIGHSLAGDKLYHGFDIGMFVELLRLPDVNLMRWSTGSYIFAFVFFMFMLFVTGGILETYRQDRRLTTGEFFACSGTFFWRFVRLLLLSIVPFVIASMIYQGLSKAADTIGDRAIADQVGIFLSFAAFILFLLLALSVRLWFDVAQVRTVARSERGMWRNMWKSWGIMRGSFGRLYGTYLLISILAWASLALGLYIWAHLGSTATPAIFIIFELIIFAQLTARLWQLGSATAWYQQREELLPADTIVYATAASVDVIQAEPRAADPGPDLPPADA